MNDTKKTQDASYPSALHKLLDEKTTTQTSTHIQTLPPSSHLPNAHFDSSPSLQPPPSYPILPKASHHQDAPPSTSSFPQSEMLFRSLTEASTDLIAHHAPDGSFLYCSPSSLNLLSLSPESLCHTHPMEYIHEEDQTCWRTMFAQALKGQRASSRPYRMRHRLGHWLWFESNCAPVFDDTRSHIHSLMTVTRDITERKHTEMKLLQAHKMESIGQLTGGVAHDFNNLLTVIISNLDFLDEISDDPFHRRLLDQAREAALRGGELTSRLLAFARKQALQPKPTDVAQLLDNLVQILRRTLGENISIHAHCQPHLGQAKVDRAMLETALLNLALNARDAMPAGGQLSITATHCQITTQHLTSLQLPPGQFIRISVKDTGSGMDLPTQQRAFDPFFTTKEIGKGSGLGLSMVYGFIKQSGGDIELESEPQRGTEIRLYLPHIQSHHDNTPTSLLTLPKTQQNECILVVEDQSEVRAVVVETLHRLGYRTYQAQHAAEALALLQQHDDIDLLFSDILLPDGMNGIELARQAHALRPKMRILFTSGFSDQNLTQSIESLGKIPLLKKPYRRHDLARFLRNVMDQ